MNGGQPDVVGSWTEVSSYAIHPEELVLYASEQYNEPDFPFRRFDPSASVSWVWANDVATMERRLVFFMTLSTARRRSTLS